MGVNGNQMHGMFGAKAYFQPDGGGMRDLGVVKEAKPSFEVEKKQLMDGANGKQRLRTERVMTVGEAWDLTLQNLNAHNLALIFGATMAAFTQASTAIVGAAHLGALGLIGLVTAAGARVFGVTSVEAVTIRATAILAVNTGSGTITIDDDLVGSFWGTAGRNVRVRGNGSIAARTLTVVSAAVVSSHVVVTVSGSLTGAATGGGGTLSLVLTENTDWKAVDLSLGLIGLLPDEDFSTLMDGDNEVLVDFTPIAIADGDAVRSLAPGAAKDTVQGALELYLADNENETRIVRTGRVSVGRNDLSLGTDDFNEIGLKMTILEDFTTATYPMGTMEQFKGAVPPDLE